MKKSFDNKKKRKIKEGDKCPACFVGVLERHSWSFGPYLECNSCGHTVFLKSNGWPLE